MTSLVSRIDRRRPHHARRPLACRTAATCRTALLCASLFLASYGMESVRAQTGSLPHTPRQIEIQRGLSDLEASCISCHAAQEPGKVHDWSLSLHARANVTCLDCHAAQLTDKDAADCPGTRAYRNVKISPVVTPKDCSRCHPREASQFALSKHARTWEIQTVEIKDPWLKGMNSTIERSTGCYVCHGSDLRSGVLTTENWPNSGCGRINPDGSLGACVICHTTHRFSIAEARRPESCGQCHLGPDHPQDEIYFQSKHGKRYLAEGHSWSYEPAPDAWEPGAHFVAPTCAACHMSGLGSLATTHDVGERLKWETQAALTVPNKDHDGKAARAKMLQACTQCHSPRWAENYLARLDETVLHYNDSYYTPIKGIMDDLYTRGILTSWPLFDEEIEWAFYEFWHHEGRRARMGAMMMGPDYAWWHGFYDLKRTYQRIVHLAEKARADGHGSPTYVPGAGGPNLTPATVTPLPEGWDGVKGLLGRPGR